MNLQSSSSDLRRVAALPSSEKSAMRIFLTGGTGFLGSHFLKTALDAGVQVRALCRPGSKPRILLPREPDWIDGNLGDAKPNWFEGCDVLVHLAAVGVSPQKVNWADAHQVNVADSMALCEAAFAAGTRNFVVCGTCMEYGSAAEAYEFIPADAALRPSGPYASSKVAFFTSIRAFCCDHASSLVYLRPFHFFGEGQFDQNFWPGLRKAALAGEDFPMTLGEQIRDFIPVETVATRFLEEAIGMVESGDRRSEIGKDQERSSASPNEERRTRNEEPESKIRITNVGTGHPQTLREFAETWWAKWRATGKLKIGAVPYRENKVMRYVPHVEGDCVAEDRR
jgi:UDP-glucose 4-epimerase